jgi:hypothetical protein
MNQEDVDPVDSQPLEAVLKRAHHAIVAVVEYGLKLEAAEPLILDGVGTEWPAQHTADFGRYDEVGARLAVERTAERVFGQSASIPWGRIEITHAAVPGGADDCCRLLVLDLLEEFAKRGRAEAELGHAHVRPAELASLQGR